MHYFERLFRNNGKIHYQGRVHNRIVGYNNPIYSQIELWHYGYDVDEDKAQEKFDRTTVLLKKDIEEDPNNPLPHHYISSSYLARGMFKEALKEAELAIQLADRSGNTNSIYGWTYFNASMSLFKLGDFNRAAKFSLSALEKYHDHLDSYYMLTVIAGEKSEWEAVCKYGENYIRVLRGLNDNPENSMMMVHNTISEAAAIYILIGHALHAGKNYNKMEEYYQKSYEAAKEKWQSSWNIGVFHLDKSLDMKIAGRFLKQAVEEAPNEYNVWYMLAKYYNKSGLKDNEIEALEKFIKLGTEEYFIFKRLFTLYVDNELNDKAFPLMESIKTPDLSSYPYLLKLGNSFMSKGLLENAFKCYMKAAELNPDRHEAWSILSEITYTLGNFEDSQVFLEMALTHKKDDITNLLIMCELKLKSGDIESHVNYLDKILNYLDIKTKRTISDFADLENLFIEIGNSPNLIVTDYLKIKSIINELDSYMNRIT
jgi:tetratricopeptide (TPR) repeat protein